MQNLVPETLEVVVHHPLAKDAVELAEILLTLLNQLTVLVDS